MIKQSGLPCVSHYRLREHILDKLQRNSPLMNRESLEGGTSLTEYKMTSERHYLRPILPGGQKHPVFDGRFNFLDF